MRFVAPYVLVMFGFDVGSRAALADAGWRQRYGVLLPSEMLEGPPIRERENDGLWANSA